MTQYSAAACFFELTQEPGQEIQLLPDGLSRSWDGRPKDAPGWLINQSIADRLTAKIHARINRSVVDYEHQTLYAEMNGKPAPAAAWWSRVQYRPGAGLFAVDVDWKDAAKAMLKADEYKYISPFIIYEKGTGVVVDILHAGLTNVPAIDGMKEVFSRAAARYSLHPDTGDNSMDIKPETLTALGLKADADAEALHTAVAALAAHKPAEGTVRVAFKTESLSLLGLDSKADSTAVVNAIAALKAKADKSDAGSADNSTRDDTIKALQAEVAALKSKQGESEVNGLIEAGLKDGRILPKMETWARSLGAVGLKAYLEEAQPIAALSGMQTANYTPLPNGQDAKWDDHLKKARGIQ